MNKVPFLNLVALYKNQEESFQKAITQVLDRGAYIGGEELNRFESDFAQWVSPQEKSYVLGCANGTDALYLAARALQLPKGSEAIVPAMTYIATVEALIHAGLSVKLVDIDPLTALMDVSALKKAISPQTKLIVPVHLYGQMAPMDAIAEIAKENNCMILEDSAQAHGALWKNQPVGHWGDIAAYSFYPGKNLGAFGDGGAILSRNQDKIQYCRALGNHGGIQKYVHNYVGVNSRLDNLQAAILGVKLPQLKSWNESRRRVASWYREGLSGLPFLKPLEVAPEAYHVYHLFVVQVEDRDSLQKHLAQNGIESGVHYPNAIHELPAFKDYFKGNFPHAESLARQGLSLPMCPTLKEEQVARVIESIRKF